MFSIVEKDKGVLTSVPTHEFSLNFCILITQHIQTMKTHFLNLIVNNTA